MDYMLENNLLSDAQYGFTPGRSTADAVQEMTKYVYGAIGRGRLSSCLFIDMRKAFDTVHHGRLLDKLGAVGANKCVLRWFKSYLENRVHCTLANDKISDPIQVTFGVPQGSILGPLLFSVYINNLPDVAENSKIVLYADDAVMINDGRTADEIALTGQPDLELITDWCATNRLTINSEKTMQVVYGTRPKTIELTNPILSIDNVDVAKVKSFCYLGVTLDENLSMKTHMAGIRKNCGYKIKRSYRIRDSIDNNTCLEIYKHCILPSLEYCSFILDSANQVDQKSLQTIQNRALRNCLRIRNPRDITQEELHERCKMPKLTMRRDCQLLLHMHKLSKVDNNIVISENPRTRAENKVRFKAMRSKLQVIKKSPLHRGIVLWNSLDLDVQKIECRHKFKTAIENIDFSPVKLRHANMAN